MLPDALDWHREGPPRPPIAGDELARRRSGSTRGPSSARLLDEIEAAVFAGEVAAADDAVAPRAGRLRRNRLRRRERADCLFCAIVAGECPAEIVDSDEHTVAFMDINPATPGHALVVPRVHSADLIEIADDDLGGPRVAAQPARRRGCEDALEPDGFNLLNACRAGGLADRLPLPPARDPALRGRPAEAAVDPAPAPSSTRSPRSPPRSGRAMTEHERAHDPARARRRGRLDRARQPAAEPVRRRGRSQRAAGPASTRSSAPTRARSSGGPRATSSPAASTSSAFKRRGRGRPRAGEGLRRAADRRRAQARGARDPDARPRPRAVPHRGARGGARLRPDLGRPSRRASASSRRSSGSPPAPAAPSGWPSAPGRRGRASS